MSTLSIGIPATSTVFVTRTDRPFWSSQKLRNYDEEVESARLHLFGAYASPEERSGELFGHIDRVEINHLIKPRVESNYPVANAIRIMRHDEIERRGIIVGDL